MILIFYRVVYKRMLSRTKRSGKRMQHQPSYSESICSEGIDLAKLGVEIVSCLCLFVDQKEFRMAKALWSGHAAGVGSSRGAEVILSGRLSWTRQGRLSDMVRGHRIRRPQRYADVEAGEDYIELNGSQCLNTEH